eukprot:gnl/TRDRNA2_/TRDRNA2_132398_c0_seq1.p3 gnl/TRDRNA2_/TRDRNA2_132398_c0~~gnl/TRDRNA2_/TRDRNA2_132398_c0_seq1.p3  ORF type:complete len:100 (-),score=15.03 gnl/TRDRNA2_/TRDRNA2_132398_c0_seq1:97-396(-)
MAICLPRFAAHGAPHLILHKKTYFAEVVKPMTTRQLIVVEMQIVQTDCTSFDVCIHGAVLPVVGTILCGEHAEHQIHVLGLLLISLYRRSVRLPECCAC